MWKILTVLISEEIYYWFECRRQFPKEPKVCCKETGGIIYESAHSQRRQSLAKNVVMTWIDYKNANNFDNRMSENVQNIRQSHKLHHESHEKLESGISSMKKPLAEVKHQWGIFKRDSPSPLLFVLAIMPIKYIFRKWTGGYKFTKSQEKMNLFMYIDDIKVNEKNEKNWRPWYKQ